MASPVIADPFHRMKYMERHGSGLRKIVRETEKPPGYTAAYNPKIFSTATDFRVILKNVNYQLSQKNLVNDQVSEQDKSPDIPHTVLNLCINYFVLITGLELQPMIEKRLDAERVFLISTGSELVVRMLGQIVFI